MALTKRTVDAAAGPEMRSAADRRRSTWYPDNGTGGVSGFGLRAYASGAKVFYLRYRTSSGRARSLRLGSYGDLTVQQARQIAREAKAVVLAGGDPQAERANARRATEISAVGQLVKRWYEDYAKVHRRSSKMDALRVRRISDDLGSVHLVDVEAARLARWHRETGSESPVEANRRLETLRAAWRWAENLGLLPDSVTDSSLFRGGRHAPIKRFREGSRERWLKPEEVRAMMAEVEREEDPFARAFFPLLLLTGLRKNELLRARWADVDLDRLELRLSETKTGRVQVRLLPEPAAAMLERLPRIVESPWVFPSPSDPAKARQDFKRPWSRIRGAAGLTDVRIHDLRRTAGSYMAQAGVPLQVIQEVLGHSHPGVTRVYARLASHNERQALDTLADALGGLLKLAATPSKTSALPERLRGLLKSAGDDSEALAAGLRGLVDWDAADA